MKFIQENIELLEEYLKNVEPSGIEPYSLLDGDFGLNSFYLEYFLKNEDNRNIELIQNNISGYINGFYSFQGERDYSLASGIGGLIFFNNYILSFFGESFIDIDSFIEIENNAFSKYQFDIETGNWDYLYGGLGGVNAALQDAESMARNQKSISKIIDGIAGKIKNRNGIEFWDTPIYPDQINLGLAHGIPGLMIIVNEVANKIGSTAASDIILEKCSSLLELFYSEREEQDFIYPAIYSFEPSNIKSRVSWCYGDLSVLYTLSYFQHKGSPILSETALLNIMNKLSRRTEKLDTLAVDLCLCHGEVGNALLQQRINELIGPTKYHFDNWLKKIDRKFDKEQLFYDRRKNLFEKNNTILNGLVGVYHGLKSLNKDSKFPIDNLLLLY